MTVEDKWGAVYVIGAVATYVLLILYTKYVTKHKDISYMDLLGGALFWPFCIAWVVMLDSIAYLDSIKVCKRLKSCREKEEGRP